MPSHNSAEEVLKRDKMLGKVSPEGDYRNGNQNRSGGDAIATLQAQHPGGHTLSTSSSALFEERSGSPKGREMKEPSNQIRSASAQAQPGSRTPASIATNGSQNLGPNDSAIGSEYAIGDEQRAGLHAVLVSQGGNPIVEEVPMGGQLDRQGVGIGDRLLAVDSHSVKDTALKVVKAMVQGQPSSLVHLQLQRPTGEKYQVRVLRTETLAEDIQLATYGELEQFLDAPMKAGFQRLSRGPNEPQHDVKLAHDRLLAKIRDLKDIGAVIEERDDLARKLDDNWRQGEAIIADLRDQLAALAASQERLQADARALQAELQDMRAKEVVAMTVSLVPDSYHTLPADPPGRKVLEEGLQREFAALLNVNVERVEIIGLHAGACKADINILPHEALSDPIQRASPHAPTAQELTALLITHCNNPTNQQGGGLLKRMQSIQLKHPHAWVERLRATMETLQVSKSRLDTELACALKDLQVMAEHKEARHSLLTKQLAEAHSEIQRLRREVGVQAEARVVQLDTAIAQRTAEERRLNDQNGRAEQDNNMLRAQINAINAKYELDMRGLQQELGEALRMNEQQREELTGMDRIQRRAQMAEDALHAVKTSLQEADTQCKLKLDRQAIQHQNELQAAVEQHAADKRLQLMHLDKSEAELRTLRNTIEPTHHKTAQLLANVEAQEKTIEILKEQLLVAEAQARRLRDEADVAVALNNTLQRKVADGEARTDLLCQNMHTLRVAQNKWERIDKRGLEELMQSQRIEMEALKNESRVIKAERASMQEHLQALNLQLTREKGGGGMAGEGEGVALLQNRLTESEERLKNRNIALHTAEETIMRQQQTMAEMEEELGRLALSPANHAPTSLQSEHLKKGQMRVKELEELVQVKESARAHAVAEAESWKMASKKNSTGENLKVNGSDNESKPFGSWFS